MQEATRRRVLAATVAALPLVMAGCKGLGALGTPPKPAADVAVTRDAITVESNLIARYGAVLAAVPSLAGELRPLLAHLDAAPPSLAQLLASISASEATHALILGIAQVSDGPGGRAGHRRRAGRRCR